MAELNREDAAKQAMEDIRMLTGAGKQESEDALNPSMAGEKLVKLLKSNFEKLDPDGNGISRSELLSAISNPQKFSEDECEMLRLIAKYFDTIINLSDDEPGEELHLSRMDMEVLSQFLIHSNLSLEELHMWCSLGDDPGDIPGPPPLAHG